jgi:putative ABC transport system substrate-binding protein
MAVHAQGQKLHRIGYLAAGAGAAGQHGVDVLRESLRELGYVEGKTIVIIPRWPKTLGELPALAAELIKHDVELIVAPSSPAVAALKQVGATMPIVFCQAADPVGSGFVASLAHPGGNITGLSILNIELSGKRVELLREMFTSNKATVLWFLSDDAPPSGVLTLTNILRETERRGAALSMQLRLLKVARPEDLAPALATLDRERDGGLIILPTPLAFAHADTVADLALKRKLPTVGDPRRFAEAGGLMAYGADYDDQIRRAATYVDKILKGARPADLPVQQPSKFVLVVNLKTAKALSLTIPPSLLLRADQVIGVE